MVDLTGMAYSTLPNAFKYRKTLVEGCRCRPQPWSEAELQRHRAYAQGHLPDSPAPARVVGIEPRIPEADDPRVVLQPPSFWLDHAYYSRPGAPRVLLDVTVTVKPPQSKCPSPSPTIGRLPIPETRCIQALRCQLSAVAVSGITGGNVNRRRFARPLRNGS